VHLDTKRHHIILGDFNNDASLPEEGYAYIRQTTPHLQDSFQVAPVTIGEFTVEKAIDGWSDNQSRIRIDYIWSSAAYRPGNHRVIFDGQQEPIVSDHFGVLVTFAELA
jgi:maltose 6'-phosphate phosphatase